MSDGTSRFSIGGQKIHHYMGCSTFSNHTVLPEIVDWYMGGKINIDPLITHELPLSRLDEAFNLMHSGESIRTVIEF